MTNKGRVQAYLRVCWGGGANVLKGGLGGLPPRTVNYCEDIKYISLTRILNYNNTSLDVIIIRKPLFKRKEMIAPTMVELAKMKKVMEPSSVLTTSSHFGVYMCLHDEAPLVTFGHLTCVVANGTQPNVTMVPLKVLQNKTKKMI